MSAGRNKNSRAGFRKKQRRRAYQDWAAHRVEVKRKKRAQRKRFK